MHKPNNQARWQQKKLSEQSEKLRKPWMLCQNDSHSPQMSQLIKFCRKTWKPHRRNSYSINGSTTFTYSLRLCCHIHVHRTSDVCVCVFSMCDCQSVQIQVKHYYFFCRRHFKRMLQCAPLRRPDRCFREAPVSYRSARIVFKWCCWVTFCVAANLD